jgi:hypothetical protein
VITKEDLQRLKGKVGIDDYIAYRVSRIEAKAAAQAPAAIASRRRAFLQKIAEALVGQNCGSKAWRAGAVWVKSLQKRNAA